MQRRSFLRTGSFVAAVGLVGFSGCGAPTGDGEPSPGETDTTTADGATGTTTDGATETTAAETTAGEPTTVRMVTENGEYYFDPIGLFVESGTAVTWTNESGSHSATAYAEGTGGAQTTRIPDGAEPWDSGILTEQGATFEHTFEVAGTYDYFCIPHKALGMVARIVVDEPGGPAEGSMPPDGNVPESQTIVEQGAVPYSEFTQ